MNAPQISVIIPAYNVEKYIQRCIDSVLAQTFADYEIIIVNDCSSDSTVEIIRKYYNDNKKIKLIQHEKNKGLALTRNTGMDNAFGEYIFFIDSDDWIQADTLAALFKLAKTSNADIAACGISAVYQDGSRKTLHSQRGMIAGGAQALPLIANDKIFVTAWNKLYSNELINKYKLRFADMYHEDIMFAIETLFYCRLYVTIPDEMYNYYQTPASIVRGKYTDKHIISYIKLCSLFNQFVNKINKEDQILNEKAIDSIYYYLMRHNISKIKQFYLQNNRYERIQMLSKVFDQRVSDSYLFVQSIFEGLMIENQRLLSQNIVLNQKLCKV